MRTIKDKIDEHPQKGVHKVTCSCYLKYIGEIGRSLKVGIKEHEANICKQCIHTSALTEHLEKTRHHICLEETSMLARENHYYKRHFKEALEIIKHPKKLNRDGGFEVSKTWVPLIKHQNQNKLNRSKF